MFRIIFAIIEGLKARKALQRILKSKARVYRTVGDIPFEVFASLDIKTLVLDFDGVLASHGEKLPTKESVAWLKRLVDFNPSMPIFIFSNKPIAQRINFFVCNFPSIEFLQNFPKKPYPDGLLYVCKKTGFKNSQVALIDDRILTGLLATTIAKCQAIYISKPLLAFNKRPVREAFFQVFKKGGKGCF